MQGNRQPSLSALDGMIASTGFPVRAETLEQAWDLAIEAPTSRAFQAKARRALGDRSEAGSGEVAILVTLRARAGRGDELEAAAREFVAAARRLPGSLESSLYRSSTDPLHFSLVERFTGEDAFERHMASDYFHRFQVAQAPLLAEPVGATFLERIEP
jgi:quinol monooxygenase YgiN